MHQHWDVEKLGTTKNRDGTGWSEAVLNADFTVNSLLRTISEPGTGECMHGLHKCKNKQKTSKKLRLAKLYVLYSMCNPAHPFGCPHVQAPAAKRARRLWACFSKAPKTVRLSESHL